MEIPAALASINAAIAIAKSLRSIEKSYDEALLKSSIADLYSALAEAKMGLSDLKDELAAKDKEIVALTEAFDRKGALVEGSDRLLYLPDDNGAPSGAPICPKCLDSAHRINVTLQRDAHKVTCLVCGSELSPVVIYPQTNGTGYAAQQDALDRGMREATAALRERGSELW